MILLAILAKKTAPPSLGSQKKTQTNFFRLIFVWKKTQVKVFSKKIFEWVGVVVAAADELAEDRQAMPNTCYFRFWIMGGSS